MRTMTEIGEQFRQLAATVCELGSETDLAIMCSAWARHEAEHPERPFLNVPATDTLAEDVANLAALGDIDVFWAAALVARDLAVDNIRRSGGWVVRERQWPSQGGWEWGPLNNGASFPCDGPDGVEGLSAHAARKYGHLLPPCSKCGDPIDRTLTGPDGLCFGCGLWADRVDTPDGIVVNNFWPDRHADGTVTHRRAWLLDRGRSGARDTSHLGFGGREWRLRPLDGGPIVETNNLWCGGGVPDAWFDEFPVTHESLGGER